MQIQRIQSVYLLLSAILMAVFTFLPVMGIASDSEMLSIGAVNVCGITHAMPLLLCLNVLIFLMALITLFKFSDLKLQMKLCKFTILFIVTLLVCIAVMAFMRRANSAVSLNWSVILPVAALVFAILAHKGIKHDKKLLSDSERIR